MKDSFTRIYPSYNHEPKTCYTKAASHMLHPKHMESLVDLKPIAEIDRYHTHKMDEIKMYSESMYKLGSFGPQPIRGIIKHK